MAADRETRSIYLAHVLRNISTCIEGCLREIEGYVSAAREAAKAFKEEEENAIFFQGVDEKALDMPSIIAGIVSRCDPPCRLFHLMWEEGKGGAGEALPTWKDQEEVAREQTQHNSPFHGCGRCPLRPRGKGS